MSNPNWPHGPQPPQGPYAPPGAPPNAWQHPPPPHLPPQQMGYPMQQQGAPWNGYPPHPMPMPVQSPPRSNTGRTIGVVFGVLAGGGLLTYRLTNTVRTIRGVQNVMEYSNQNTAPDPTYDPTSVRGYVPSTTSADPLQATPPVECDLPGPDETMEQFCKRCGSPPDLCASVDPATSTAPNAATPASEASCDLPKEDETDVQFCQRCGSPPGFCEGIEVPPKPSPKPPTSNSRTHPHR